MRIKATVRCKAPHPMCCACIIGKHDITMPNARVGGTVRETRCVCVCVCSREMQFASSAWDTVQQQCRALGRKRFVQIHCMRPEVSAWAVAGAGSVTPRDESIRSF